MVVSGLDFYIRKKKMVNQHLVDLAQLGEKVGQIEQLRLKSIKDVLSPQNCRTMTVMIYETNLTCSCHLYL